MVSSQCLGGIILNNFYKEKFMNMKQNIFRIIIGSIVLSFSVTACASTEKAKQSTKQSIDQTAQAISKTGITQLNLDNLTASWPTSSRMAFLDLTKKYRTSNEASARMVVWHNKGPWKRSIVYKNEVTHLFPKKHAAVLQQFVDYKVPVDKFDDIANYDGSVIVERTKGEMVHFC